MTSSTFSVSNPANQAVIAEVQNMTPVDALAAVQKAESALPSWRAKTGKERAAIMRRWFDLINRDADRLAKLMTEEQGKALLEAKGEVIYAASFIEWFAEEAKRVMGAVPASPWTDKRLMVLKQPIGVCVSITPWNFPLAMITRKVAPAIAAGCTIVIKPAEQTPLSALALGELAKEAGIPDGVINIVTADAANSVAIGQTLCAAPAVRHLSFTGSTPVGRILMEQCAPTIKKVALELGGHAPFIVFEDADLDAAVEGAIQSKYRNAGQTCVCTNRFYVHQSLHDAFVQKLAEALEFGMVGVNTGIISNEVAPFGGVKQSGLGREGSVWGIEEYLEMKYVCLGL